MMNFGERLYKERMKREWTQQYLADKAGLRRVAIARLENKYNDPSLASLRKLCSAFNCSWNTLLGKP